MERGSGANDENVEDVKGSLDYKRSRIELKIYIA